MAVSQFNDGPLPEPILCSIPEPTRISSSCTFCSGERPTKLILKSRKRRNERRVLTRFIGQARASIGLARASIGNHQQKDCPNLKCHQANSTTQPVIIHIITCSALCLLYINIKPTKNKLGCTYSKQTIETINTTPHQIKTNLA